MFKYSWFDEEQHEKDLEHAEEFLNSFNALMDYKVDVLFEAGYRVKRSPIEIIDLPKLKLAEMVEKTIGEIVYGKNITMTDSPHDFSLENLDSMSPEEAEHLKKKDDNVYWFRVTGSEIRFRDYKKLYEIAKATFVECGSNFSGIPYVEISAGSKNIKVGGDKLERI